MFCGECGKEIRDDAAFCPNCGTKVKDAEPQTTQTSPSSNISPQRSVQTGGYTAYQSSAGTAGTAGIAAILTAFFAKIAALFSKKVTIGSLVLDAKVIVIAVAGIAVVTTSATSYFRSRHDLSGTYYCTRQEFLFDSITFWKNGKVQVDGGVFAGTGVVGTYRKIDDYYYIELTKTADGSFGAGRATVMMADYTVEKRGANTLHLEIIPMSGLYAWIFETAEFVKY